MSAPENTKIVATFRERLAILRDERRGDKDLYVSLTYCIGSLYHVQEAFERQGKTVCPGYGEFETAAVARLVSVD